MIEVLIENGAGAASIILPTNGKLAPFKSDSEQKTGIKLVLGSCFAISLYCCRAQPYAGTTASALEKID